MTKNLPQIYDPDPREVIARNSEQFEALHPHYNRSWVFDGEPLPYDVPDKTPYEIICDRLGPVHRFIWTLFYVYVLPKMEEAFIKHQEIEYIKNAPKALLGTMSIPMKEDKGQFYYVRFMEQLDNREVEIVENKIVTNGSPSQHQHISKQIQSMNWWVELAEPWANGLIETDDMIRGMREIVGFTTPKTNK